MALKELLEIYAIIYHLGNLQTSFAMSDQRAGSSVQVVDKRPWPIWNFVKPEVTPSLNRPRVAVFDFDDTLCTTLYGTDSMKKYHPECPYIEVPNSFTYAFLPYLRILFEYLFKKGVRIAFFSSEDKKRNMGRIPPFLTCLFGNQTYESLKSKGEFEIFSYENLGRGNRSLRTEGLEAEYVKVLRVVIRDGELLSDVVLVDDDTSYTTHDQRPLLQVPALYKWKCEEEDNRTNTFSEELFDRRDYYDGNFPKNSIYYILGVFKTYFEHEKYKKLPFREGLKQILPQRNFSYPKMQFAPFYNDFFRKHPFVGGMIDIGLSEVQKQVPNAKFYGKGRSSGLYFYQLLAYVAGHIAIE